MFGGVRRASGGVSSRSAANESTMNNTITRRSQRLVNHLRKTSSGLRRQRCGPKPPNPFRVAHTTKDDTPNASDATASIADNLTLESRESLPQGLQRLHKSQRIHKEKGSETHLQGGQDPRLDANSTCSLVSSNSDSDLRALKLQHAAQFSKLLPRDNNSQTGLRKTLSRKPAIRNLIRASSVSLACFNASKNLKGDSSDEKEETPKSNVATISAPLRDGNGRTLSEAKTHPVLLPQNQPKRPIPQGHSLEAVQLGLQELILSQITQKAIDYAQQDNVSVKGKGASCKSLNDDVQPNERDRELEITQELTKRVRATLHGGSCDGLCLAIHELRALSQSDKEVVLCDILLMLRRAFREILAGFDRPYQPTGTPVTDQEVMEEMDAYLVAQKDLNISHAHMTVGDVLKSLDVETGKAEQTSGLGA